MDGRMNTATEYEATEYEQRISRALARIAAALEKRRHIPEPPPEDAAPDTATDPGIDPGALASARAENARLQQEITRLQQQNRAYAAERDATRERLAAMDDALQSLRTAQAGLTGTMAELRAALAGQVAEPELVNRAMQAELEALSAQRRADMAEMDAVLGELAPLVEPQVEGEAPDATG